MKKGQQESILHNGAVLWYVKVLFCGMLPTIGTFGSRASPDPLPHSPSVLRSFLRPTHMPPRGNAGRAAAAADGGSPQTRATPQTEFPAGDLPGTLADITADLGALDNSGGDVPAPITCTSCSNNNSTSCTTMPSWRRPRNNSRGSSVALAGRLHRRRHRRRNRRRTFRLSWQLLCPASS